MKHTLLAQRLLALAVLGWLVLDFPLLGIVLGSGDAGAMLLGWPRSAWLLFALWALVIVVLALLMERGAYGEDGEHGERGARGERGERD